MGYAFYTNNDEELIKFFKKELNLYNLKETLIMKTRL